MKNEKYCGIVLDLMPLVRDNTASEDSRQFVLSHMEHCPGCREMYGDVPRPEKVDDKRILRAIRRQLSLAALVLFVLGGLAGVFLSNSAGMFYNFLIMPAFGAAGYLLFKRRRYLIPIGIFAFSFVWLLIFNWQDGMLQDGWDTSILAASLYLSAIYTAFTLVGMLIARLLKFAFGGGKGK